jgi:hypothetical protein
MIVVRWMMADLVSDGARGSKARASGVLELRYGRGMSRIGLLLALGLPLAFLALTLILPPSLGARIVIGAIQALCIVVGLAFLLESRNAGAYIDAEGITTKSLFGRIKHIGWNAIISIRFSPAGYIEIASEKSELQLNALLGGLPEFWSMAKVRAPAAHSDTVQDQWAQYLRRFGARVA